MASSARVTVRVLLLAMYLVHMFSIAPALGSVDAPDDEDLEFASGSALSGGSSSNTKEGEGLVHSICANWISVVLVSAAFVLTLMFRSNPTALPIAMAKPLEQKEDRRKPASVPPPKTDVHPPSVPPPKTDVHPPQATDAASTTKSTSGCFEGLTRYLPRATDGDPDGPVPLSDGRVFASHAEFYGMYAANCHVDVNPNYAGDE